jgi:diguanylate cyclase (GGDEF)-like protein/PAS domain S-box-containing protein
MHRNSPRPYQERLGWTMVALAVPLFWWVAYPTRSLVIDPKTFVLLHTAAEVFAVVVAMLIFVTGYRAILSVRKGVVVLLGVSFLGVGLLDFLHTMSYVGMPDALSVNTPHKSMVFWLAARLLAAAALLVYVVMPNGPAITQLQRRLAVAIMLASVGIFASVGLLMPDRLPALFVQGVGLTSLKIQLEWLTIFVNLGTLAVLWQRRATLMNECVWALGFAVGFSALSALFFTQLGIVDKDGANAIGHAYKVVAYLYLFQATFNESLRRPMERMAVQHKREKLILSAAPDGILWISSSGKILMANPAMETISGYPSSALVGQNVDIFLPPNLRVRHAESMRGYFIAPNPRAMGLADMKLMCRDGKMLPVDISLGHWEDDGERHAIAYIRDLTERVKFEDSLKHQATHDDLTGLPNRWLFRMQLNQALTHAAHSGNQLAVLLLDLDGFKTVNDTFGHGTGDDLLVQAGARMRGVLRKKDTLARMGGDEFAILLTNLVDADDAVRVVAQLLAVLSSSYQLQNLEIFSSASVGLAFSPNDASDGDTLLRYADMAMYNAKDAGRGTYSLYSNSMDRHVLEDMQMHTRLRDAIANNTLTLHYQPQVDVNSGAIVGAEALLRWFDPVLGQVSPEKFIPLAEATGLILPISDWVLDTACAQIAAWTLAGTPVRVAINVSAQQFSQTDLPQKVSSALARTGAHAQWLDIEVTETVAMKQPEQARAQLNALVALGCGVALDDFGTGYSSLAYLKALPVRKLKIDKSFMDGVPHDANDVAISRAIIAMAKSMGMTLIAEGVETDAQLAFLRQHGCESYQGWLFSKAVKADDLTRLLRGVLQD